LTASYFGCFTKISRLDDKYSPDKKGVKMKAKLSLVWLMAVFFSVSALYAQFNGHSNVYNNTMGVFKSDVDKLQDVNDYSEVAINKAYIMAGSRYDTELKTIRGITLGFAGYLNDLYIGTLFDGYLYDGYLTLDDNASNDKGSFIFNDNFNWLLGKASFGGIGINVNFDNVSFAGAKDAVTDITTLTKGGMINFGATWGKNFAFKDGTLKPKLGFLVGINQNETTKNDGNTTVTTGHGPSALKLYLTTEYLFPKKDQLQTTLSFGYIPLFTFPFEDNGPPKVKYDGTYYNTIYGEIKYVTEITENLSLGGLTGLSLAINSPSVYKEYSIFEFGFLVRSSIAFTYKVSDKFLFNAGFRLGALEPDIVTDTIYTDTGLKSNIHDSCGVFYHGEDHKDNTKNGTVYLLSYVGAWGLGMLWQPEKAFSADFSVSSLMNNAPGTGLNFSVLFTLNR